MLKALIVTSQLQEGQKLLEVLNTQGASTKLLSDVTQALEWMKQRPFDVLVVDDTLEKAQYGELGLALWSVNPLALAFVTGFQDELREGAAFYKVLGLHPVSYSELVETLQASEGLESGRLEGEDGDAFQLLKGKTFPVLVVEDLDSPRDIICIFVESLGFPDVTGVASASEALSLLEKDPTHYRCVLTDIRMPKISGKELIEIIRSHNRLQHLPIIVLTAHGTLDMLVDCLRLGASGFLVKPPKKEDMMRELSRALRIDQQKEHPRLASQQEAEYIRKLVEEKKVM